MSAAAGGFVVFEGVCKSFGAQRVLEGLDLHILEGETMVVLGPSGIGKSVLLRHVIGLMRPDSGHVWVDGEDVTEMREKQLRSVRRKVGMLFQGGALFDSLSVGDNVAFPLREHHPDWDEERVLARVARVMELVDLPGVEEKMPSALSGGMRKRVALARSIAIQPKGILYDEPTTGLDPVTARTINDLIRGLQRRLGVTAIVVTHDIDSAFYVADRVAYMHDGRMAFVGTPEEAERSRDPHLSAFLEARMSGGAA